VSPPFFIVYRQNGVYFSTEGNMNRETVLQIISRLMPQLRGYGIQSLALFGSVARNEATAESDVDVLVDFAVPVTFDNYFDVKFLLEDTLGCKVDLVTKTGIRKEVLPIIQNELVNAT